MKRFLFVGCLLLGVGQVSYAQVDDIYANGSDQRQGVYDNSRNNNAQGNYNNNNNGQGYNGDVYNNYNNPDDYIDEDEDVSYSSRISRFNYGFYNMGYYSMFYNPFWYNRYWYDPYYSWNPWRTSFGLSFGYGPYWSSGWGWSSWYGYGAWGSCWNYPCYAYGGWGGGYWNRYYNTGDVRYNNGGVRYAPRQVGYASGGVRGEGVRPGSGLRQVNYGNNTRPSAFNNNYATQAPRGQQYNNNGQSTGRQRSGLARFFGAGRNNESRGYSNGSDRYSGGRGGNYSNGGATRSTFGNGGGGRSFSTPRSSGGSSGGSRSFGGGGRSSGGGGGATRSGGGGASRSGGGHSGGRR